MTDIFVEQIVKKKKGPKDTLIIGLTILIGLALVTLSTRIPWLILFFPIVLIGVCAGGYYIITSRNLEFEYSVTNGDITIDKIINRRRRKRVISVDAHNIEDMGKFKPEIVKQKDSYKPFFASEYDSGAGSWYFCAHSSKEGNVLVVFDPEEKVMHAIKPFIPRQVASVVFDRH